MKRLIFGLLVLVALSSGKVIKSDAIVFPDDEFESHHKPLLDLDDSFTNNRQYFSEPRFRGPAHVMPLSLNAEPLDFNIIQQRFKQLRHNIVKRSPGWKSKGSSKSKGSGSGYFSSKAKGNNKGQDQHNSGYNSNKHNQQHSSAPQQPAYNPSYHPAPPPSYGHASPTYGGHPAPAYGHPAPAYGQPAPAYGQPAYHPAQPAYHPPAPQQPSVVVIDRGSGGGGGGGYAPQMKGPGLGTALATGLASGVGSGVGFGAANAIIGGITGGGSRHPAYPESRPAPPPQNNDNSGNGNSNNNNNNNQNNNDNFNAQANPECLKTCYSTEEYAPVCGTDGWEYTNIGKLNCMKTCGKRVEVARYGNCYVPPPPGYGVQPGTPGAVAPAPGAAVPPPPPNSPVDTPAAGAAPLAPVSPATGLPAGVEDANGFKAGVEPDSTSTLSPLSTTTVSPEYAECIQKCNATSEYNPQCSTDGVEYANPGRVQCAKGCGRAVEIAFAGLCASPTPSEATTTLKP